MWACAHTLANIICVFGDVAHLAERFVRNEEAVGSIPIISTSKVKRETRPSAGSLYRELLAPVRPGAAASFFPELELADGD